MTWSIESDPPDIKTVLDLAYPIMVRAWLPTKNPIVYHIPRPDTREFRVLWLPGFSNIAVEKRTYTQWEDHDGIVAYWTRSHGLVDVTDSTGRNFILFDPEKLTPPSSR